MIWLSQVFVVFSAFSKESHQKFVGAVATRFAPSKQTLLFFKKCTPAELHSKGMGQHKSGMQPEYSRKNWVRLLPKAGGL